MAYIFGILFRY